MSLPRNLLNLHALKAAGVMVAAAAALLALAPSAQAAVRLVAPGGSDGSDCLAVPCASLQRAYSVAGSGDVITVAPGSYGDQEIPSGNKSITVQGLPGNKIRQIKSQADNITFDGLDLDAGGETTTGAVFEHGGALNVTLKNSRVGNVLNEKGAMLGGSSSTNPTNLVIDNVEFHDVMARGENIHNECIMAHAPGITIRNSTFRACHTMDISLGRGDWWGQPPYGNVVLENNLFGHSVNGSGWHYYGLAWFVGKFENARVVNNTFENQVRMESQHIGSGPYSGVWANNIGGGWACLPGVTYAGNVGKKCGASDIAVNPSSSCGPPACASLRNMRVGWADPAAFDFSLQASSPAVNNGSAQYAPSTDKRGLARDARPDAGALEYGAGPLGGPGPSGGVRHDRLVAALRRPAAEGHLPQRAPRLPIVDQAAVAARAPGEGHRARAAPAQGQGAQARPGPGAEEGRGPQGRSPARPALRRRPLSRDRAGHRRLRSGLGAGPAAAAGPLGAGAPRRSVAPSRCRSRTAATSCRFGHWGARRRAAPK